MLDLYNNLKWTQVVDPVVISADADGASVDMRGFKSCAFIFAVGESGDTLSGTVYVELEIEESDDDSSFTDVADAQVRSDGGAAISGNNTGTVAVIDAAAEDDVVVIGEYLGSSRYIRPVINVSGTHTNGIPIGVVAIQGNPTYAPAN